MKTEESEVADPSPSDARTRGIDINGMLSLKGFLLSCALLSLACLLTSFVLDSHISTHTGNPVRFETLSVDIELPSATIGAIKVDVSGENSFTYKSLDEYNRDATQRSIDYRSIEVFLATDLRNTLGFQLPITTIGYAAWMTVPIYLLECLSVVLAVGAIGLQLWFREVPDSFILKPGISSRISAANLQRLKSGLPGFFLLASACVSMVLTVVISSFMHNMVFRLVAYAIFNSGVSGEFLASYRVAMTGESVSTKQEQLKLMQFIGRFLTDRKHVSFSWSFYLLMASMALNLTVLFVLYWNDNKAARAKVEAVDAPSSVTSQAAARAEAGWKQLPTHCRVRSIWTSAFIFLGGMGVTAIGGNVARRRGVKMNRHPFEVAGAPQTFIDDVVISHTQNYFFSTGGIVDAAVLVFTPIMIMLAIVSIDRLKFASKVMELYGIIFFMRGLAVMATIMPTLYNVLQHPQCWDVPGNKLADMLAEKEFCNDCMFSGHTVFCFFPALIFVYSIIYGPYSYKPLLIASVLLSATLLTSLIVVGRLHYTSDVVVAIVLTFLLVIMNAPVWKLLFSFRKSQLGVGSLSAIDKVPGFLEMCVERLNLYTTTVEESAEDGDNKESWSKVDAIYAQLGELIEAASTQAAADEEEDHDIDLLNNSIEEILHSEESKPLLSSPSV